MNLTASNQSKTPVISIFPVLSLFLPPFLNCFFFLLPSLCLFHVAAMMLYYLLSNCLLLGSGHYLVPSFVVLPCDTKLII